MPDAYQSTHINFIDILNMQQVRSNRESMSEITTHGGDDAPVIVRTDLSSLLSDYTTSQRRYNNRLESLEREMASLKSQVNQATVPSDEDELNRTFTIKKAPISQPTSARVMSPSRIPLRITPRRLSNDDKSIVPTNDTSTSRPLPPVPIARSKTFHNNTPQSSSNTSDDASLLRSYKAHLEQVFHKNAPPYSDIKVPNYTCTEDVIKANEQLLLENDRLRSELNRLKTESILLIRSMKTNTTGIEPNLGNERIIAERERQELAMELTRQVEENKRLRKSLLAQSTKFLTLRQSTNISDAALSTSIDHRLTPESAPQSLPNSSRNSQSKSARYNMGKRGFVRAKTFYDSSHDPL